MVGNLQRLPQSMADALAQLRTLSYPKGTVTATRGLLQYLFGVQFSSWLAPVSDSTGTSGRRRRKYGTKQRTNARAGRVLYLKLSNGETYSVRVTGTDLDFVAWIRERADEVEQIYTARGTIYGPQFAPAAA